MTLYRIQRSLKRQKSTYQWTSRWSNRNRNRYRSIRTTADSSV